MNIRARYDGELDEYYVTCPNCGEITYLNDIDEEERDILDDGEDAIEYWCDNCDNTIIVQGPKYYKEDGEY